MTVFTPYPAIDVRDGRVVRLRQGDYSNETRYPSEPLALAQDYARAGADWLHLVDLDAARAGGYTLTQLLANIKQHTALRVQTGGGIRSDDEIQRLFDAGADRVVVGSLAVRDPDRVAIWLRRFGVERIVIALDTRCDSGGIWRLPINGWTENSGIELDSLLDRHAQAGIRHLLCTDIHRDGMLGGPNVELYARLARDWPQLAVQASGGVHHLSDIGALRKAGCAGVVLGKALLDGLMDLNDVVRAC